MEKQDNLQQIAQDQTTYETPEIIEHGSIEALTQSGGGQGADTALGSVLT